MKILKKIMCHFGFHDWEIENHGVRSDSYSDQLHWKYHRTCLHCGDVENLVRSKNYNPTKSVWEKATD